MSKPRPITITLTRDLSTEDLNQVQALRRTRHYPDPFDPRYSKSGLHLEFSDAELRARHEGDPSSRYIYARSSEGALEGYMRISTLDPKATPVVARLTEIQALLSPELRAHPVLFVAVVVVAAHMEGRFVPIEGEAIDRRLAESMYYRALTYGEDFGCHIAVADVYVSPQANSRSLAFHHRLGFRSLGYPLVVETLAGVEIHSLRLAKVFPALHSLERRADGLWHETSRLRLRDPE